MWKRLLISGVVVMVIISYTNFKNDFISASNVNSSEVTSIIENVNVEVESVLAFENIQADADQNSLSDENYESSSEDALSNQNLIDGSETDFISNSNSNNQNDSFDKSGQTSAIVIAAPSRSATRQNEVAFDTDAAYDDICAKYVDKMASLEEIAQNALDELMESAKMEYLLADEETRGKLDFRGVLVSKYYVLANDLEDLLDDAVSENLENLESELLANSFDTGIIKVLNDTYQEEKKERREEIMSDILAKVWNN